MTKKIKNTSKLEIPKDILKEKSIIEKFAPENKAAAKSDNKPIDKMEALKDIFIDEKELLEYMDSAIKDNIKAHAKSKGKQMDEVFKTLDHIMPEFYQTAMIFGFNVLGEKCVYMLANSEKDREALFHFIKSTVFNMQGDHQ